MKKFRDSVPVSKQAMESVSVRRQKANSNAANGSAPLSCGVYPEGIVGATPAIDAALSGAAQECAPPMLIGGINLHNNKMDLEEHEGVLGVDWIQGTIPLEKTGLFYDYMSKCCGTLPEILPYGQFRYDRQAVWHPYGIKLFFDSTSGRCRDVHQGRCAIQMPATALNCFDADSLFQLVKDLVRLFWFQSTRLDLCYDDYDRIICPHEVAAEARKGNFTGYRRFEHLAPQKLNGDLEGDTLYFGRRGKNGSGRFLRCYDKDLQTKGAVCSIRWEVEFSKEKARDIFFRLSQLNSMEEFAAMIAALIGGSIDFVDRKGIHLDRMQRLDFWERIVSQLGAVKFRNPKRVKSVEKAQDWIERSVVPSVEMLRKALGDEHFYTWFESQIKGAKLSKYQRRVIDDYWDKKGKPKAYQYTPF
jgi:DNA relaxase NicK